MNTTTAAAAAGETTSLSAGAVELDNARSAWSDRPQNDEFPLRFGIIVVSSSFCLVAAVCLIILTSSSRRPCCRRHANSSVPRTRRAVVHSLSAGALEPRLVGFVAAAGKQADSTNIEERPIPNQASSLDLEEDPRLTEPATSATARSTYTLDDRSDLSTANNCLQEVRSSTDRLNPSGVPVTADSAATDGRHITSGMTTPLVSTRVDSGVSGMQSSVCSLSLQPPELDVASGTWSEALYEDRVDVPVGGPAFWSQSQTSIDVRSCPGGTVTSSNVTLPPPLFLCQYVNGYSEAILMHVDGHQHRPSRSSGDVSHTASTIATHSAADADDTSRCCGDDVATIRAGRGAAVVQTRAIVEPRPTHQPAESQCVCGQQQHQHDLPPHPRSPSPTDSLHVHSVTTKTPSSPTEIDRRRLLARLLLGRCEELAFSPVHWEETYF